MAKGLGNAYLLWIESAVAGTFNVVKGQQGVKITRTAAKVDLSSKDDGGYGSTAPGVRTVSLTATVLPNLPDANGYTRLESLAAASPALPFNIQIRKGGLAGAPADVVFAASVYGTLDSTDFALNAATPVAVTLDVVGAPVTDVLAV